MVYVFCAVVLVALAAWAAPEDDRPAWAAVAVVASVGYAIVWTSPWWVGALALGGGA